MDVLWDAFCDIALVVGLMAIILLLAIGTAAYLINRSTPFSLPKRNSLPEQGELDVDTRTGTLEPHRPTH